MAATTIAQSILAGRKLLLWIGAGASSSAGIPTDTDTEDGLAYKLALIHFNNDRAQITAQLGARFRLAELAEVLQKSGVRQLIIQQGWMDRQPAPAHRAMAALVAEGFNVEIVTVNYDPLIENGLKNEGLNPTVICSPRTVRDLAECATFVIKIHGCPFTDHDPANLLMSARELQDPPPWITAFLNDRLMERVFVYVGFSGNAPYVWQCVEQATANLNGDVNTAYGIDIRQSDSLFKDGDPLGEFYRTSHVAEEAYLPIGSDSALTEIADHVFRGIMLKQLQRAEREAERRGYRGSGWLADILNSMSYTAIRSFCRKAGLLSTSDASPRARDLRISTIFEWMLILAAKNILESSSFRPSLSCPYFPGQNGTAAAPVVFFDSMAQDVATSADLITQMSKRGELRTFQVAGEPRWYAVLVNCRGYFTNASLEVIERDAESVKQDYNPIVFLDEHTMLANLDRLEERFR